MPTLVSDLSLSHKFNCLNRGVKTTVTVNKYGDRPNRMWMELYGLSTDEKPVKTLGTIGIGNASTFYEMDTGNIYIYDEENHKWWNM